jgi:hypothetical protein
MIGSLILVAARARESANIDTKLASPVPASERVHIPRRHIGITDNKIAREKVLDFFKKDLKKVGLSFSDTIDIAEKFLQITVSFPIAVTIALPFPATTIEPAYTILGECNTSSSSDICK